MLSVRSLASLRRPAGADSRRPLLLAMAAIVAILLPAADALPQGTAGSFPSPRSGRELDRWLGEAGVPDDRLDAAFEVHARYLGEVARLRDGEIEAWLRAVPPPWFHSEPETMRTQVAAAVARIDQQRRLVARLDALEEQMWNEIGAAAALPPPAVAGLLQRGRLARLSDFEASGAFWSFGTARPASLATLLEAAKASPAEAARIREVLAGHDASLAKLLEEQRDLALDQERRQAEAKLVQAEAWAETRRLVEEEMAAANAEGREARTQEIYEDANRAPFSFGGNPEQDRLRARMLRLQLAAVRAIEPVVGTPGRLAKVLVAAGIGRDGSEEFFEMFEEFGRSGKISPAQLERVAEIRQRAFAENLPQRLAIAELQAQRLELGGGWGPRDDGSFGPSPELEEIDAQMQALQGDDAEQRQMAMIVELGQAVGSGVFGEAMRAYGRKSGIPEPVIEQMVSQLVAGIDAGAIDAEEMQKGLMRSLWSAPPSWRVIDAETLAAIFDDLGVAAEMRLVASQLIADGTPRFEAAIAATASELAPQQDASLDPQSVATAMLSGADGSRLAAIDAGLQRVLAADEAFFNDLTDLLGEEVAPSMAPWRAVRRRQMIAAACDGGGIMHWAVMAMQTDHGDFAGLDLFPIAASSIPEALADPAVRAAFAVQAERIAELQQARWSSMRSLLPQRHGLMNTDTTGAPVPVDPELAMRVMSIDRNLGLERQAIGRSIREDLVRLQASLDPSMASEFRRAALLAAWGDRFGGMPAREAIADARARAEASGDAARVAALDALAARYAAATDASLDLLWRTSDELQSAAREGEATDDGRIAVEGNRWWASAVERAAFRQAEADFAATRACRTP